MARIKISEYIGLKFNKLTIIKQAETNNKGLRCVLAKCDCGIEKIIPVAYVISGNNKSCGCHKLNTSHLNFHNKSNHGLKHTPLYNVFMGMKERCYNPNHVAYKNYGGRGIKICDEWAEDVSAFAEWALNNGWKKGLHIDRINNNGNYEPSNCRIVTAKENCYNKRTSKFISYNGITKTVTEWSRDLNINKGTLYSRLKRSKWLPEKALTTKVA